MMHKLQTRLLLTFISIAAVALLLVVLFAMLGTRSQFEAYVTRDSFINLNQTAQLFRGAMLVEDTAVLQNLTQEVANTYQAVSTIYDEQGVIVAATDPTQVGQKVTDEPLPTSGLALRLVSEDEQVGTVYFFSTDLNNDEADLVFIQVRTGDKSAVDPQFVIREEDEMDHDQVIVGPPPFTIPLGATVPVLSPNVLVDAAASQQTFWEFVNRVFAWAAAASIFVAVVLSWFTSRHIVRPVNELAIAAQKMGQGELATRVAIQGGDELANLGRSFNQMAADLSHQEELRRHLVTDVAHELLTPLTTVRGRLEAIQDGILAPEPTVIASLHDEVMLLDSLIADLQELSLAEAGQLQLDWQMVAVADVLGATVTAVQSQTNAKNITIKTAVPDDMPLVPMDARRMGQVLRNLLINGITYTEPDGEITVTVELLETAVQISVQDSGSGIAPEDLPLVFDRFYRGDKSRTRATGGFGLGLAIVKGIVEAHNGCVSVTSQPGQGAAFSLTLPLESVFSK